MHCYVTVSEMSSFPWNPCPYWMSLEMVVDLSVSLVMNEMLHSLPLKSLRLLSLVRLYYHMDVAWITLP